MGSIRGANAGGSWYWLFEYSTSVNKLVGTISYSLKLVQGTTYTLRDNCSASVYWGSTLITSFPNSSSVPAGTKRTGTFSVNLDSTGKASETVKLYGTIGGWSERDGSGNISFSGGWSDAGGSTVNSIVDNNNNTVTINTTFGSNGVNNAVSDVHIYYRWSNSEPSTTSYDGMSGTGTISGRTKKFTINIPSGKTQLKVKAYSISAKSDNPGGTSLLGTVKYHTSAKSPTISIVAYKKDEITLATKYTNKCMYKLNLGNDGSNGQNNTFSKFEINLYKNSTVVNAITHTSLNSINFHQSDFGGLTKGDKIKFGIKTLVTPDGYSDKVEKYSSELTIVSAGVVRIKVNGVWKEAIPYVKTANGFKECEGVYVKSGTQWKETE